MKRLIFLLALLLLPFSLRAQNINTLDPMDNDTVDESGIDPWTDWTGKFVDGHVVKTSPALDTTGWEYQYDRIKKFDLFPEYWLCYVDSTPIVEPHYNSIDDWAKEHGFKKARPQLKVYRHEEPDLKYTPPAPYQKIDHAKSCPYCGNCSPQKSGPEWTTAMYCSDGCCNYSTYGFQCMRTHKYWSFEINECDNYHFVKDTLIYYQYLLDSMVQCTKPKPPEENSDWLPATFDTLTNIGYITWDDIDSVVPPVLNPNNAIAMHTLDSAEYAALKELIAWWEAGARVERYEIILDSFAQTSRSVYRAVKEK